MKQGEIEEVLMKEFNLSEKQVKLIIGSFWLEVRKYFTNPIISKGKILLPHIGSFFINQYAVKSAIKSIKTSGVKRRIRTLEFYEELNQVLQSNERQTSKKGDNE